MADGRLPLGQTIEDGAAGGSPSAWNVRFRSCSTIRLGILTVELMFNHGRLLLWLERVGCIALARCGRESLPDPCPAERAERFSARAGASPAAGSLASALPSGPSRGFPGRAAPARPRRSWLLSFRQHTPSADLVPPAAPAGVSPGILQPSLSHRAGEVPPTRPPVRQAGDAASPELAIMAAARPTARCPYRGARAHHHARVENAREDIRGGGPAEQAGSRVLHRVDDLAQPDALGPGGSQPWAATPLGVGSGIIYQLHVFRCVRRESSDRRLDRVLWGSPRTHPLGSGPSAPGGLRGGRERGSGRRNGAG